MSVSRPANNRLSGPSGLLLWALCLGAQAAASEPLPVSNLSPLANLFALPAQRSAMIEQRWSASLDGTIANHFVVQGGRNEKLVLDGQTDGMALTFRYGWSQSWDVEVRVPWLRHHGGFTDQLISDWHRWFGLPNGDRDRYANDQLRYHYQTSVGSQDLTQAASGLGDVQLAVSRAIPLATSHSAALSVGIKVPTGDEDQRLGSGALDLFASARMSGQSPGKGALAWHAQIGMMHTGDSDVVLAEQRRHLWFAGAALEWRWTPRWSAVLQFDAHRGLAKSSLDALGQNAGMLSLAARWRPTPRWQVDAGFSEDVVVESAPDIVFRVSARYRPAN